MAGNGAGIHVVAPAGRETDDDANRFSLVETVLGESVGAAGAEKYDNSDDSDTTDIIQCLHLTSQPDCDRSPSSNRDFSISKLVYFKISFSLDTSAGSSFKISLTFCSKVAPSSGLMSRFAFFASPRNSGSFIVSMNALRMICTRSFGVF